MLTILTVLVLVAVFQAGVAYGQAKYGAPKTVLHVVTGKWKAEATDEQKKAALDGLRTMLGQLPGVKNVWLKADRIQPREYNYAFAIEFENRAAADAYANHPAHEEWYKVYQPIREESRSQQLTNE
ncbi:MAG TPA: Dabb family protein [Candidatus Xenobia bacterium]|nr:Dabb family protein [Candidatus Xenobia bacterium]